MSSSLAVFTFTTALIMGTFSTMSSKILYEMEGINSEGEVVKFAKPLMVTFIMFLAMIVALPIHYGYFIIKGQKASGISKKMFFTLSLPALTDLIATTLYMIGLLYVSTSVYQLIRCLVIVFTAVLKRFLLKSHVSVPAWTGVLINFLSVGLVSASALFQGDSSKAGESHTGFGIILIAIGAFLNATQFVLEEKVMATGETTTPPLIVVGMEGFWGTIIMLFMFAATRHIPGKDVGGCYENLYDTFFMMYHNSNIGVMCFLYLCAITSYNVSAIFITFLLESVWRSILENFRPIAVWGTQLFVFYVLSMPRFGEAWTVWSWLQLGGMAGLLLGTATYNENLKWPCISYTSSECEQLLPSSSYSSFTSKANVDSVIGIDRVTSSKLLLSPSSKTNPFNLEHMEDETHL